MPGATSGVREFLLPAGVSRVEGVFVNGVPQAAGRDYRVEGARVRFTRALAPRRPPGAWGRLLIALCASVDATGDSVDAIVVDGGGRRSLTLAPATAPPGAETRRSPG
jgi:hypothetical protein